MQSPPPETYTYPQRVPESTNDVNLKRARVVDNNGKSYIRVTGTVTSSDLEPIKEALGEPTDTSSDNTVIGLLKKIDVKQFGVGQAYPSSTGGEIFNYYGTDSNKNIASGKYSTARGLHNTSSGICAISSGTNNTASGAYSTAIGQSNTASGGTSFAAGTNNAASGVYSTAIGQANTASGGTSFTAGMSNTASTTGTIALGAYNQNSGNYAITLGVGNTATALNTLACGNYNNVKSQNSQAFGEGNTIDTSSNNSSIFGRSNTIKKAGVIIGSNNEITTQTGNVLIGSDLTDNTSNNVVIVGCYNTAPTISNPKLILASGGGSTTKTNAIECNANTTKIRNNLQLATNSYEVNDITAPLSSPASAKDKTLTSEAWVRRRVRLYTDYVVLFPSDYVDLTLGVDEVALLQLTSPDVNQTVMLILNGSQSQTYFPYGHQFNWSSGRLTNASSYEFDIVDGLIFKI